MKYNDNRIWIRGTSGDFLLMSKGFTSLEERWKTALLETPNVFSAVCGREILYHTGQLEFEGIWGPADGAINLLYELKYKRGADAKVTLIVANRKEAMTGNGMLMARQVTGYVCVENPASGEGVMGSVIKGKIVYDSEPIRGIFDEIGKTFYPS